jgi:hypothetical protein
LKKLELPTDQYVIIGSGALGIRNIKEIGDIDIMVSPELWITLSKKYEITNENGVKKIIFPDGIIEAFYEGSFYTAPEDLQAPSIPSRIENAELIEGLPFDSIETVLYYKRKNGREKDLKDILLIEQWMRIQKPIDNL